MNRARASGRDAHGALDHAFACAEKSPIHAMQHIRDALRSNSTDVAVLVRAAEAMVKAGFPDKAARVAGAAEARAATSAEHDMVDRLHRLVYPASLAAKIPAELLVHVFSHLDPPALERAMCVCRSWRRCIASSAQLWANVVVGPAGGDARRRVQLQTSRLSMVLGRARAQLQSVTLVPPLSNMPTARALLDPRRSYLRALSITCAPENAGVWLSWAVDSGIEALSIETTESRTRTHAWLTAPVRLGGASLRSLRLIGTPPLDSDAGTLAAVSRLHTLVYGTGPSYGRARAARLRHSETLSAIIRAASQSLETLELDGEAVWSLDFFPVSTGNQPFPRLVHLKAPLRSVVPGSVDGQSLFPALRELETQISPARGPGASPTALLSFARSTRELRRLCIRGLSDTPAWLADSLMRIWRDLTVLEFRADEQVYSAAPIAHETRQALLARPLCASTLVKLMIPAQRPDGTRETLLVRLAALAFGPDVSLRGPELIELVRRRAEDAPISAVDVDLCLSLDLGALPILSQYTSVHWDSASSARCQLRACASRTVETLGRAL